MGTPGIIYIIPMTHSAIDCLSSLAESIEEQFEFDVRILENLGPPDFAFDPVRKQYSSNLIIGMLLRTNLSNSLKILGVTDQDLFNPIFSFVFGEAQFGGKCAVISSFRLLGPPDGKPQPSCPPLLDRLEKEAVHELGHTFGLRHCADPDCVMSFSKGVQCADRKFGVFCHACRDLMLWYSQSARPV